MPNNLKIEYINIGEIKTYENNAKLHPKEQIEQIKKSIQEFGFNDPIAIDKDNIIIEGHGRYIACKELGIKELPVIRLENLTDEQKRAYMLVHNKLTMNSDFDIDILNEELENIFDIDMSVFDFEILELEEEKEIVEDEVPKVPEEPKSKLGDIYQLGNHRLMCGDSTNLENIEKILDNQKPNMVYTDAPYGISIVNNKTHKVGAGNLAKNREYIEVKGDDTTDTARLFFENCTALGIEHFILWGGKLLRRFFTF